MLLLAIWLIFCLNGWQTDPLIWQDGNFQCCFLYLCLENTVYVFNKMSMKCLHRIKSTKRAIIFTQTLFFFYSEDVEDEDEAQFNRDMTLYTLLGLEKKNWNLVLSHVKKWRLLHVTLYIDVWYSAVLVVLRWIT